MKTPIVEIVEYEGDQLEIDFDLDRPQLSICPKCSSKKIHPSKKRCTKLCGVNDPASATDARERAPRQRIL